ncbi:MAG: threonine efflux protein [Paracoccaceae bacterium]|jgi:threonine efflux protein
MYDINLFLILGAALLAVASPGPATLAIAGTSMQQGRAAGLALAAGVTTGSFIWSISAAFGLGAVMRANVWLFEILRYFGAGYLMYLAYRSAKSALQPGTPVPVSVQTPALSAAYGRGLALHLTNPKAILFFGSLYAIGLPVDTTAKDLIIVVLAIGIQSCLVFHGYALMFSNPTLTKSYLRLRRPLEAVFAAAFATASWRILIARLT